MSVVAIIQARLSSTRLPDKILLELLPHKTVLKSMIERVEQSKLIDKVIVATTNNPNDKKLVQYVADLGVNYFVGSEDDVLDRYYQAAKQVCGPDDIIVRLTSDCPLADPAVIDEVVQDYLDNKFDFVSNSLDPYSYPDGLDVEVFSFAKLQQVWRDATLPSHREHVTFYFWQNPQLFKIKYHKNLRDLSHYRLTLDYPQDYELIKAVYRHFTAQNKPDFSFYDVIDFLDAHPEVKAINATIQQNAGWQPALEKDHDFLNNKNMV